MVAVSGIGTFDVYKRYINPNATGAQILRVNRMCIMSVAPPGEGFATQHLRMDFEKTC